MADISLSESSSTRQRGTICGEVPHIFREGVQQGYRLNDRFRPLVLSPL